MDTSKSGTVYPVDFSSEDITIINKVLPYTIVSLERLKSVIDSVRYIISNNIPGAFVECGVYKGGCIMTIALTLLAEGVQDREIFLYDTFEGMPEPTLKDVDFQGNKAINKFEQFKKDQNSSNWVYCSLDDVKCNIDKTGYPEQKTRYIKGLVEKTLPETMPENIAMLRLDTDWYSSTRHELIHLYPKVSNGGIVIIDDYGHFQGAREAVDHYLIETKQKAFLHRIDYTGRLIVKNTTI